MLLREPKAFNPFADCGPELSHTLDRLGGYTFGMLNLLVMSECPDRPLTVPELSDKFVAAQGLPPTWIPEEATFKTLINKKSSHPFIISRQRAGEGNVLEGILSERGLEQAVPVAGVALGCQINDARPVLRALLGDPSRQAEATPELPLGASSARFCILRHLDSAAGPVLTEDIIHTIQPYSRSNVYQTMYRLRELGVIETIASGRRTGRRARISESYTNIVHNLVGQLVALDTPEGRENAQNHVKDILRYEQDFSYLSLLAYDARQGRGKGHTASC